MDSRTDVSASRHHDPDQGKTKGIQDPKIANTHEKETATGKASSPSPAERTQVAKVPEPPADDSGLRPKICDKEPCKASEPKLLGPPVVAGDPRPKICDKEPCKVPEPRLLGPPVAVVPQPVSCKDASCKVCPPGSSAVKDGGACAVNVPPGTAPKVAAACPPGSSWNGGRCVNTAAAAAQADPSPSQCAYFSSQSNMISLELTVAKERVREACGKDRYSAECTFAELHESMTKQSCQMLQTQTPIGCTGKIASCL